jgi:hypothetical protein
MASLIGTRVNERDEMSDAGVALEILIADHRTGLFTLGYNDHGRNPCYSPCLSFPEAFYLLQNAKHSGIFIIEPSESLLCYVESLRSFSPAHSKLFAGRISKKPSADSAKQSSLEKPGKVEKFSIAPESSV